MSAAGPSLRGRLSLLRSPIARGGDFAFDAVEPDELKHGVLGRALVRPHLQRRTVRNGLQKRDRIVLDRGNPSIGRPAQIQLNGRLLFGLKIDVRFIVPGLIGGKLKRELDTLLATMNGKVDGPVISMLNWFEDGAYQRAIINR